MQQKGNCTVCLREDIVYCTEELDENNVSFATKLKVTVPEVKWTKDYYICICCMKPLDVAYKFKQQCLVSHLILDKQSYDLHRDQEIKNEHDLQVKNDEENNDDNTEINDTIEDVVKIDTLSEYSCSYCNEYFHTQTDLVDHDRLVHSHKKYTCTVCQEEFRNEYEFRNHGKIHKHVCNICDKSYSSKHALKEHIEVKHLENKFWKHSCCYCNEVFPTKTYLLKHSKKHQSSQEIFFCSHCSKGLKDKNILLYHIVELHQKNVDTSIQKQGVQREIGNVMESNGVQNPVGLNSDPLPVGKTEESSEKIPSGKKRPCRVFTCEHCDQVLNSSKKLIDHCVNLHNLDPKSIKPFVCDLCNKKFSTSTILIEHKRYHTRNRQNICSYCGKGFITKNDLNCHEYIHLNERSFKCEICFKGFNTQKNLRTHKIVKHGDPMSWKHCCTICNKRFAILSNYKVHVRRHMGDKQFCCHLCDKKFVNKDELRQHTDSHSNVREFKCKECGKEYKKKRVYEIHLAKAHGIGDAKIPKKEKKHMCHMCPKSYYDKSKLKRHLLGHAGIKPYACTKCDKKFNDNYYLKQHMKNTHELDMTSMEFT